MTPRPYYQSRSTFFALAQPELGGSSGGFCERGSRLCASKGAGAVTETAASEAQRRQSRWKDLEMETPEALQSLVDAHFKEGLQRVVCSPFIRSRTPQSLLSL